MDKVENLDPAHADDKLKQINQETGKKALEPPELEKLASKNQKGSEVPTPSTIRTSLLPPFFAVYSVWARTSAFDTQGSATGKMTEASLDQLKDQAIKAGEMESQYFFRAMILMDASMRNLEIIYKGRELNFKENEGLRTAYLESVTNSATFGQTANDLVKSLPTMTFTGAAGSLVVSQAFKSQITDFQIALAVAGFAAIGFLINLLWVRHTQNEKLKNYVVQDYDRSIYYEHYLHRTKNVLVELYKDLNSLHKIVFLKPYATKDEETAELKGIDDLIGKVEPQVCPNFHKHMAEGLTSYDMWSRCETGIMHEKCPKRETT